MTDDDATLNVRAYVEGWLARERAYTVEKFGLDQDDQHVKEFGKGFFIPWWDQQFDNYLHRSKVLGLDTPGGRQALAKFTATALGMLEAAVRVYGPLPEAGVPSGENLDRLVEL